MKVIIHDGSVCKATNPTNEPQAEVECDVCGTISLHHAGQFLRDNRWVCSETCRKELIEQDAQNDLVASGGIVDAP